MKRVGDQERTVAPATASERIHSPARIAIWHDACKSPGTVSCLQVCYLNPNPGRHILNMNTRTRVVSSLLLLIAAIAQLHASERPRVIHDLAHGENPLPDRLRGLTEKVGVTVTDSKGPITSETLRGAQLLYLRAPSKEFTDHERASITAFVRAGGSLLVVLDEEARQPLATTRLNELIGEFGLRLTPDLPYLHNCGAVALPGVIHAARRELPYSGGRAVEGGTPFAFVLDKDGNPAEAFATSATVPGGGRVVVMGEGMASLAMGTPDGVRLSGVPRDASKTTYWGKDSAIFLEELFSWLLNRPRAG
jgi:hypothetical protein